MSIGCLVISSVLLITMFIVHVVFRPSFDLTIENELLLWYNSNGKRENKKIY